MATGTGNLPYPMSPVSPFDVITSQAENEKIANIESLADGTGIGDKAITASKLDFATLNFGNYSTSEVDTGFKWIDGKSIYKRTVNFGTLPNNTYKAINHGITSIDRFVTIDTIVSDPTGSSHVLNSAYGHSTTRESIFVTKTQIGMDTVTDRSAFSAHVTMWYTKTA